MEKKTRDNERSQLHSTIWDMANKLRGAVDGWDFKQYVLGFLFYRFISENLTEYINKNEIATGNLDFNYADLSDEDAEMGREQTLEEKGLYILPSELFENVRKNAKNDSNLNVTLDTIFKNIENSAKGYKSERSVKGLFDDLEINSNKLGDTVVSRNEKLVKILDSIGDLKLGKYHDNEIDVFGDAYEYLMSMYASNAGKSGGEFFTPQEVGELLARITLIGKKEVNRVYDPTCGSGSLLLKFAKILGKENVKQGFYGQEYNITTYNLCRINMFLHDINYNNFHIARGDTLTNPMHWDEQPFDAIVSNPPYSISWDGKKNPILINDPRFSPAGVLAPEGFADLAFVMHMLSWLAPNGTAAIVSFPGVLYRGNTEQKIRKYLVENNYIDAIIQLPSDLFYGTGTPTCILVLKKNKKDNNTLFINASEEYVNVNNGRKLSSENIDNILNYIIKRRDIDEKAKLISQELINLNNYNLAISNYITKEEVKALFSIEELNKKIQEVTDRTNDLRNEINSIIDNIQGEN